MGGSKHTFFFRLKGSAILEIISRVMKISSKAIIK